MGFLDAETRERPTDKDIKELLRASAEENLRWRTARNVALNSSLSATKRKGAFEWWYMPLSKVGDGIYWKYGGRLHRIGLPPHIGAAYRRWRAG